VYSAVNSDSMVNYVSSAVNSDSMVNYVSSAVNPNMICGECEDDSITERPTCNFSVDVKYFRFACKPSYLRVSYNSMILVGRRECIWRGD